METCLAEMLVSIELAGLVFKGVLPWQAVMVLTPREWHKRRDMDGTNIFRAQLVLTLNISPVFDFFFIIAVVTEALMTYFESENMSLLGVSWVWL